jgi:hypothetical protein
MNASQAASKKQSTPPIFRMTLEACLPMCLPKKGCSSPEPVIQNLTTWIEETKNPPAFVQTDRVMLRKSAKRHPLRIYRPVVMLAVSITPFNDN